ncbi:hypothetical protein [bacterium endosymbiont of Bathymodiolus sp. 5 South]|jgi:hypothetical protein|uniref:hypothetical protein n=1 Tax=bacterium endosymbiont of Bathymodiolus sp. 5 South TaxID=1181670 RepID=UPI0010B2D146|nr:hypothetical protein [bacterium endosymbiont of Bathymodiolus sp. 5 South]CAC9643978.1 putative type II restriction endonuclease [uncultured Gammaproteobacteria bacterium]CAC9655498.1 putative type II restriction endonuclease [uncultured Gammaproteobacteria bacterium]CAC9655968.1 putative type II restriction endonuclease [uncultured Gammaproteobacteria bacterium]CAC9657913.1 putative type II restriction endonuclease [uncultured Gammaproteobacteria bacterium]SHN92513.1 putative type II restr
MIVPIYAKVSLNEIYQIEDAKEKITIADSFVVRANKIGLGNGEAKLYVGQGNFLEVQALL